MITYVFIHGNNRQPAGTPMNVLAGVINNQKEDVFEKIRIWGRTDREWRILEETEYLLEAGCHEHLYFLIPGTCFTPEFWDLEELEEIELAAESKEPDDRTPRLLVDII